MRASFPEMRILPFHQVVSRVARASRCALPLVACAALLGPPALAQPRLKVNGITALVLVPQVGLEWARDPRTSVQVDVTASFWRSVDGAPMQFVMLVPEWRRHLRALGSGPYFGLHVGATAFKLQKWNYRGTDKYQEGFGLLAGATIGYERTLASGWVLDAFLGGGTVQTKYKGYLLSTGERYDGEPGFNESGEWLPYRGGVMLSYRPR